MQEKEMKTIYTPSLYVFATELEEAILEGWSIDLENGAPTQFGIHYEVGLVRLVDKEEVKKLSRAEILEKARAAKAEKAKQTAEQTVGD